MASIRRCHRRDRGSIPRQEGFFSFLSRLAVRPAPSLPVRKAFAPAKPARREARPLAPRQDLTLAWYYLMPSSEALMQLVIAGAQTLEHVKAVVLSQRSTPCRSRHHSLGTHHMAHGSVRTFIL